MLRRYHYLTIYGNQCKNNLKIDFAGICRHLNINLSRRFPGSAEEKHEDSLTVPTGIRTESLLNKFLQHHRRLS